MTTVQSPPRKRGRGEGGGEEVQTRSNRGESEERNGNKKDRRGGFDKKMKGGEKGGKATLTPHTQSSSFSSSGVLTDVLEAGIHRSIIKIHTADSQRIQVGIVMPHHLNTHTHTPLPSHSSTDSCAHVMWCLIPIRPAVR